MERKYINFSILNSPEPTVQYFFLLKPSYSFLKVDDNLKKQAPGSGLSYPKPKTSQVRSSGAINKMLTWKIKK